MSCTNRARDRGDDGRLKRQLRRPHHATESTPSWWISLYMNRPQRRENHRLCHRVMVGDDPEGMTWPVGSRRPHKYFH